MSMSMMISHRLFAAASAEATKTIKHVNRQNVIEVDNASTLSRPAHGRGRGASRRASGPIQWSSVMKLS